jgi:hypothetical protein
MSIDVLLLALFLLVEQVFWQKQEDGWLSSEMGG